MKISWLISTMYKISGSKPGIAVDVIVVELGDMHRLTVSPFSG